MPSYKSGMPAFGDQLNRQEIFDVPTHIKSPRGDSAKRGLPIREAQALVSKRDPFPREEELAMEEEIARPGDEIYQRDGRAQWSKTTRQRSPALLPWAKRKGSRGVPLRALGGG